MRLKDLLHPCLVLLLACVLCGPVVAAGAGAHVTYAAGTPETGAAVVTRYGELPKGVVVEGVAEGFDPLTSVAYDKEHNEFTVNGNLKYRSPVSKREFLEILNALRGDDRMGVGLRDADFRVFGDLKADSGLVQQMGAADKILAGIIFGFDWLLQGVKLPDGYKPQRCANRKIQIVAFTRFTNYLFEKSKENYQRASCTMDIQVFPLSEKKSASGGHLPDMEKAKEGVMEAEDRANLEHLRAHQAEYVQQIPAFAETAAIGEAAAFARLIRDAKLDTDGFLGSF